MTSMEITLKSGVSRSLHVQAFLCLLKIIYLVLEVQKQKSCKVFPDAPLVSHLGLGAGVMAAQIKYCSIFCTHTKED